MLGYITFEQARATQDAELERAIDRLSAEVTAQAQAGAFTGPGPVFLGIGASLAAACAPVWSLRARGIHAWRLGAGDLPLPFPTSTHPIIGVSQSGRSAETLAALESIDSRYRYAVVNSTPSPIESVVSASLSLGNIADSYASSIGYTATIVGLGMIADVWDGGRIDPGWRALPALFRETAAALAPRVPQLAAIFRDVVSADFVGAGPSVGSAEAGALLFREVARLHASAMGTRQYLHGSMESAGDGAHVLFGEDRELEVAHTLARAGHEVLLITEATTVAESDRLRVITLPRCAPAQKAILEALVLQLLVAEAATQRGVEIEEFVFHNSDTKVGDEAVGASA
jgi:fructoselysine-6-P-deglycase FrlB-like protein